MSLFGKKEKAEIARLRAQMSPEQITLADINEEIAKARDILVSVEKAVDSKKEEFKKATAKLEIVKAQIIETDEAVLLQSFGFYTPHYIYATSDEYKEKIQSIRAEQKAMVKSGDAVSGRESWSVNGDATKGKKMVKDMQKLFLRAFNAECDDAIDHVKFNNIGSCENKIRASAEAISKLGSIMGISITYRYEQAKIQELRLVHEYKVKLQKEKDEAKEARQRQREEAKVLKELEESRKKLEKEKAHFLNELARIDAQIATSSDPADLIEKRKEIEARIAEVCTQIQDVDYRAQNQKAGYVYIISNIGAFGENVYKIGMTRRLEPMERINELGDASVPFDFDVHALIFSEDAPKLEASLHAAFENKKLNAINHRREFFNVSLDEIKAVIKENYNKTVEFVDIAPAEQYRQSIALRNL